MEQNERAFDFFLGAIVGVLGNFVVSAIIELAQSSFANSSDSVISYWALMFMLSSIFFFQVVKIALRRFLGTQNISLRMFDTASGICFALGIFIIFLRIVF
jgi:hypothetical protein